ncbi:MAG: STAS domain-containing protein [Ignavibacteriae bacterium]|nr:anti-sigma factor antagonist [Ignavibacteriota bacterium]NOG97353.1 STAS domain-containing protein [Ignavibacteriota bacterium]
MIPYKQEIIGKLTIIKFVCTTTSSVNAAKFKDYLFHLHEYTDGKIIIDLKDILFIDSAFIGALVVYFKHYKNRNHKAKIVCGKSSGDIWEMFVTTKSFREMNCYSSLEDALIDFNLELEKVA